MLHIILTNLLTKLVEDGELLLHEGADVSALSQRLLTQTKEASIGTTFGQWLSKALLNAPEVEELYVTDAELVQRLKDVHL